MKLPISVPLDLADVISHQVICQGCQRRENACADKVEYGYHVMITPNPILLAWKEAINAIISHVSLVGIAGFSRCEENTPACNNSKKTTYILYQDNFKFYRLILDSLMIPSFEFN
jgi:hypothetical protein